MNLRERLSKIEKTSPIIQRLRRIKILGYKIENDEPTRDEAVALVNAEIQAIVDLREQLTPIAELSKSQGWKEVREEVTKRMVKMARLEHVLIIRGEYAKAQEVAIRIESWRDLLRLVGGYEKQYDTVVDVMLAAKTGELMEILSVDHIDKKEEE